MCACPPAQINLSSNNIDPEGAKAVGEALKDNTSLTSVNVLSNQLDVESANLLLKVKSEKPNFRTLCGLVHNETELDLSLGTLGPGDAKLLAAEIVVMPSLKEVNIDGFALPHHGPDLTRSQAVEPPCVTQRIGNVRRPVQRLLSWNVL